jgi:glycosyltransferase involved in cell wall biosynthesis
MLPQLGKQAALLRAESAEHSQNCCRPHTGVVNSRLLTFSEAILSTMKAKPKLALLLNMISPYRLPIYSALADQFDLLLLHGGKEANRDSWSNFEDALPKAKVVRAWGWQIRGAKKIKGKVFDERFIHITPGIAWHLLCFNPDLIISNEMGFRSVIALAYATVFQKPAWIWWGGTLHSERNICWLKKVLRKAITLWADHWVTYGQTSTEYLLSWGVKRERILQSQNGIDEERFKTTVEPAWMIQPQPVVLHVGQFIERKGIGLLLEAAAALQKRGWEFSLLLVGSGRDKEKLERRAQSLDLKNVHFLPAQPPDRMPSVYRSADVVVFPTLEDVWGLVANEAILSGIPVLCSKYAGCAPELFSPENIFSPEDLNEFTEKLGAAILGRISRTDPSRLKTIGQLSGELVQELHKSLPGGQNAGQSESGAAVG